MELVEIVSNLEALPSDLEEQGAKVENALLKMKEKELELQTKRSSLYIQYKNDPAQKRSHEFIESLINVDTEELEGEYISAEAKYRTEHLKYQMLQAKLDSVKKLANLEEARIKGRLS